MRKVLFAVHPVGAGRAVRCLAIAEALQQLFPAVEPHFLATGGGATLLRALGEFPVEEALHPVRPAAGDLEGPVEPGRLLHRQARRLAPHHSREVVTAARRSRPDLVVVDGIFGAPPSLRRAGFASVFLCDHLLDLPEPRSWWQRGGAAVLRRSVVGSTRLRFFVGEPASLKSPELRVWARKHFRFTGPISGLARAPSLVDIRSRRPAHEAGAEVLLVGGASAYGAPTLRLALDAGAALRVRQPEVTVRAIAGPELVIDDPPEGIQVVDPTPDLPRLLAGADLCVVPAGLTLLTECAGLGVATLCLPLHGDEGQARFARLFHGRAGLGMLEEHEQDTARLARAMEEMLASAPRAGFRDAATPDEQRLNAASVADGIAELLGRRRPAAAR